MNTDKIYCCDICEQKKSFAIAFLYPEGEITICAECLVGLAEPFITFNSIYYKNEES